ncbi:MAG TPA: hypothetical protein VFX65_14095 [Candidatus Limnocylindrales bacterium]|nr:hypothetical protein [Candidatus Limnocylindrales bacterium]
MRRRKVTYPPPKTATSGGKNANANPGADARAAAAASRTVSINLEAMAGRPEVVQGGRVQIASGLYAGELATVESIVGGVIPAAVVSTDAGRTRRVRTVDLIPVTGEAPKAG